MKRIHKISKEIQGIIQEAENALKRDERNDVEQNSGGKKKEKQTAEDQNSGAAQNYKTLFIDIKRTPPFFQQALQGCEFVSVEITYIWN